MGRPVAAGGRLRVRRRSRHRGDRRAIDWLLRHSAGGRLCRLRSNSNTPLSRLGPYELQDRLLRTGERSFVLMVAGEMPGDPEVAKSLSLAGVFIGVRIVPNTSNAQC